MPAAQAQATIQLQVIAFGGGRRGPRGLGFRVWGLGFRVLGFRVIGCRVIGPPTLAPLDGKRR